MPSLWLVNQFANTPDLPGHTRQFELAKELVQYGWEVEVFSSDFNLLERRFCKLKRNQLIRYESFGGFKFTWLRVFPYIKNDWRRYINLASFGLHLFCRFFLSILTSTLLGDKGKPDLILASSPQLPAAFLCMWIAKIFRIPFILEVRDLWPQVLIDQDGQDPKSLFISILSWMEHRIYESSNHVVVLAKGVEEYVFARGAKNISWLPNGPDIDQFKQIPLPIELNGFNEQRPFKIVYTGAHGNVNALDNIIETARLLKHLPIKFCFVGDGPEKRTLISSAKDLSNVDFCNPIPKLQIPKLVASADAMLISLGDVPLFRYGVSPNKLYDAYAFGRPVITTVPGLINDEVSRELLGVVSPPENPAELAKSIIKLFFTSRSERKAMGYRARKLAEITYSRQIVSAQYEEILRNLVVK